MRFFLVVSLLVATACAVSSPPDDSSEIEENEKGVESWESMSVAALNSMIENAEAQGKDWPSSPALVAFHLAGGDGEMRLFQLNREANRAEDPKEFNVTVTGDGFLDDSVRGTKHRFVLNRSPEGKLRVVEAHRARRCWRDDGSRFRASPCP